MEKIAFVFQDNMVFTDTIENNIRMGNKNATFEQVQQAVVYLFVRMKSYIMSCCGMAEGMKKSRIDMGEHLRKLSLGFFSRRDTGELSTVLLRDFTTIENLANSFAPQIAITLVRIVLSFIMLCFFDVRMAVALFITIPCAIPFAFISYKRMNVSGIELMDSQQEAASEILEYVEGIKTLRAFNVAGEQFEKLKSAFDKQRKAAVHVSRRAVITDKYGISGRVSVP